MRRRLVNILVCTLLVLLPLAAGSPHHEDYDEASMDVGILQKYLESSVGELNLTLLAINEYDPASAVGHSLNYSDLVKRAKDVLSEIPDSVDSYGVLSSMVEVMSRAEGNLTITARMFKEALFYLPHIEDLDLGPWEYASLRQNLTLMDRAVRYYGWSVDRMDKGIAGLLKDISSMRSADLDVSGPMESLYPVRGIVEDLSARTISPEDVAKAVELRLIPAWGYGLEDIASEEDPDPSLNGMSNVLGRVLSELSPAVYEPLNDTLAIFISAYDGLLMFREAQVSFLLSLEALKNGSEEVDFTKRYSLLFRANSDIQSMEEALEGQKEVSEDLGVPHPIIDAEILKLETMIKNYREKLGSVEIFNDELAELAEELEVLILKNTLEADIDGDGSIGLTEVQMTEDIEAPIEEAELLRGNTTGMDSRIGSLPSPYWEDISALFQPLRESCYAACDLTLDHGFFLDSIRGLSPDNGSGGGDERYFLDALGALIGMKGRLSLLESTSSFMDPELGFDNGSFGPLNILLDMYMDLLARVAERFNNTFLVLDLDRKVGPYDSLMGISVVLMKVLPGKGVEYPRGETVELKLDGIHLMNLTTTGGPSMGSFTIDRSLTVGEHRLNATLNTSEGTFYDGGTFGVRKIITRSSIGTVASQAVVGKEFQVHLRVADEFSRPVSGNVTLNGELISLNGSATIELTFDEVGNRTLVLRYGGDEHLSPSEAQVEIEVSRGSELVLRMNRTVVRLGEQVEGTLEIVFGEGIARVVVGNMTISLGRAGTPTMLDFDINSTNLGVGNHTLRGYLETRVDWVSSGWSNSLVLKVLPPEEPEEVPPDDGSPLPEEPAGNATASGRRDFSDLFSWVVITAIVFTVILAVGLAFFIARTRKRTRELEKDAPPVEMPLEEEEIDGMRRTAHGRRIIFPKVNTNLARRYLGEQVIDKNKAIVISTYLELLSRAPGELDLNMDLTPREVGEHLIAKGAEKDLTERITFSFEEAVYMKEPPTPSMAVKFREDAGEMLGWFGTIERGAET